MARMSTCKGCEKKVTSEEKHTYNSKPYCNVCYEKVLKDGNEYKQLIDFICVNYDINVPTGFILKQIKEMKEKYLYTYGGMTYTLWYCKEVLGKKLLVKYGISLIQYYYSEASEYFIQQEESKRRMEELKDIEIKTKVIKMKKQTKNKTTDNNNTLVNLNNLLGGENN